MDWCEERHTGITEACGLLNPIKHFILQPGIAALDPYLLRPWKKELILNKQSLVFLSGVKRPLNLLADRQQWSFLLLAVTGCCVASWGQSHYELHAQNWENNLIYHETIPIIICAPKALPFHPLLQMFLRLKVLANSSLWTTWHDSLEHLPIKLNILSVLGVKSSL